MPPRHGLQTFRAISSRATISNWIRFISIRFPSQSALIYAARPRRQCLRAKLSRPRHKPFASAARAKPITSSQPQAYDSPTALNRSLPKRASAFFGRPYKENLKIEARAGFAALQIDADGQLVLAGPNAAGELQVNELRDVSQAGLELALVAKGKVDEKTSYEAGVEAMTPFVNNKVAGDKRNSTELTNVDGFAKLTSNITSWAAFSYDYKLKIQPQLQIRAQQIHMLVLNVNYNLF